MASLATVRIGTGTLLTRSFAQRSTSLTGSLIPSKTFAVTAVCKARNYGPDSSIGHDPHATGHWKQERIMSAALLPIVPVALIFPNPVLDTLLSATVIIHTHWGLNAAITDYVHIDPALKIIRPSILILSILAFGGLCYLNYKDMGFGNACRALYSQI